MGFALLKMAARKRLSGGYFKAVLGAAVYYIPVYLVSMLNTLLIVKGIGFGALSLIIGAIFNIAVIDIFFVGYIRSLIKMSDSAESNPDGKGNYDVNLVLSGYQDNFGNTIKIMFTKRLYLFGWKLLTVVPIFAVAGIVAIMAYKPEISQMFTLIMELIKTPTEAAAQNVAVHIYSSCSYVAYMLMGASVLSGMLAIPYLRKIYEYEMIPMILAEDSGISRQEAFSRTREIMDGFKFKYFLLQLSFLWFIIAAFMLASLILPTDWMVYVIAALIMPYMYMTYIMFYFALTRKQNTAGEAEYIEVDE